MSFADHLPPRLAERLTALGWGPDDPRIRGAVPTTARAHNFVAITPPAPAYAGPVLAGMLAARPAGSTHPVLVLAPPESLAEWTLVTEALTEGSDLRPLVALGPGQPARRLHRDRSSNLFVMAPATALELRRRTLLPAHEIASLLVAWPETWDDTELLTELMEGVEREVQRVFLTSNPGLTAGLIERYAWRAMTTPVPAEAQPEGPVRTVTVPWSRRVAVLAEIAEVVDPESLAVWTADRSREAVLHRALTGLGVPVQVTHGTPDPASLVIAFDPPDRERLTALRSVGDVILLVPPGTARYLDGIAAPRQRLALPAELDAATGEAARRRARIIRTMESGQLDSGLLALSQLYEKYEPARVAAALYQLWTAEPPSRAPAPEPPPGGVGRVWVGFGRKDSASTADLIGLLTGELHLDRSHIGRIEIRETFSLVEVPEAEAARIAQGITGRMLRRRRLIAKVDERPSRGGPRSGSGGGGRSRARS